MPNFKRRLKKKQRLADHRAKLRAGSRRITIDCPECHSNVGIPIDVYQTGVESDQDKQLTTLQLRGDVTSMSVLISASAPLDALIFASAEIQSTFKGNPLNFICGECGYREGASDFRPKQM